ncbi:MAG: 30S ribosome-binding factor RbfA [Desulfopila sp.]|jgi:ribosome-binding factor A|nr:30S ribosome-binding factor RbfA [Desulfopila sp.]
MNSWDPKSTIDSLGIGKKEKKRPARVADVIRNELSILLIQKVRDPSLAGVALSRVLVTDDLKYAKIYYTVLKQGKAVQAAGKALERAKGFMRSHLAKTLNLRYTPALQFFYDETVEKVEEVEKLFREIELEKKDNENS